MIFSKVTSAKALALSTALAVMVCTPVMAELAPKVKDVVPRYMSVSLLRQNDKTGEAYLRLNAQTAMNGCPRVSELKSTVDVEPPSLLVNIQGYTIDYTDMPRNPQYGCKTGIQYAKAEIPLDRKLIEDNKLDKVNFTLGKGGYSSTYKIVLNKNSLELVADDSMYFEAGKMPKGGQVALLHWYYPANTLVLTAPGVPAAQRDQVIADFARAHNMTAVKEIIPEFVAPAGQENRHYYIDDAGKIIETVPDNKDVAVSNKVSARRPGTYE